MAEALKAALVRSLGELDSQPIAKVLETRSARLQSFGVFAGA
jgi:acetyl-CoA carboxylase alpha subunit